MSRVTLALVVFAALAAPHPGASAGETPIPAQKTLLGDRSAGSRAQPVHVIPLKDPEGDTIQPEDRRLLPFSTVQTCGADCHNAPLISRGWHFNAALPGALAGRKGQPWIWVDLSTATQLPLSYRSWPGTYKPSDLGIGAREFAVRFGGRTPGGLTADGADSQAGRARWKVSGDLEVNCLVCHDASPAYDQAEYAHQVALENFRYAPTAASGIAVIAGSAKQMSGLFDYLLPGSVEDALQTDVPAVHYAANRFMPGEKVAFDILREVKSARCYYCHTNADVQRTGEARWEAGEDVHVARGLACVACHRNGLDHSIVRGYEGEPAAARDAFAASLTCRGCHLHTAAGPHAGLGAPYPKHAGLPPVHLEKLTCTACHSGPWPDGGTHRMKNGLTHGLGEHNVNPALDALPHIYYPVFAQQEDGKLAPYRAIWPAFWGRLQAGRVAPLNPQEVKRVLEQAKLSRETAPDATWPKIDEAWVVQVLRLLDRNGAGPGAPVYITGGKLRRLGASGRLQIEDHPQAEPYLWPLGHDVRPASEALGAHGCEDCHSTTSAVLFGNVFVDSPLGGEPDWKMNRFEKKLDIAYQATLARSWVYRPWLKFAGVTAASMLLLLLLGYVLKGLLSLSARVAGVD